MIPAFIRTMEAPSGTLLRLLLLVILLPAGACKMVPAKLKRVAKGHQILSADQDLQRCFDTIEREPDSPEAKSHLAALITECRTRLKKTPSAQSLRLLPGMNLAFTPPGPGIYGHSYFDELDPVSDYQVARLTVSTREGAGLPMIGRRENKAREPIEAHYPPESIARPVTAVAEVTRAANGSRVMRITLYSPLSHETALVNGREKTLAADFTAPFAALLQRTGKLRNAGLQGLISAPKARKSQLYLMEPYDPNREPLILIHGLLSSPLGWASLTNDLWSNPDVRRRYQIWQFYYPTSAPFLYPASLLREQLDTVNKLLASQDYPKTRPITIIAHSMGGLLTRTLITTSGDKVWNTVMAVPPGTMLGTKSDLSSLEKILMWKARPDIHRVIFVCVPHRGSDLSQNVVGRVGDALAKLPTEYVQLYTKLYYDNPNALQDSFRKRLAEGKLSSIDTLSPKHPVLPVMNDLPFAPWVSIHSIIGNRGRPGPLDRSSDGVVPYTSSHVESALSEKIVPAGHGAFRHPVAIAEIFRILKLP